MKLFKILFILYTISLTISCTDNVKVLNNSSSFFDLKAFFITELSNFKNHKKLKKRIEINGKSEQQIITEFNLEEELGLFIESDINKTNWLDQYNVDSTFNNGQLKKINYICANPDLRTKEMNVFFSGSKFDSITIRNETSNFIVEGDQQLKYKSDGSYQIKQRQKVLFSDESNYNIFVNILD